MTDTIQLKAGNKSTMPALADREPAFVRDEGALYIGTPEGNLKLNGALEERLAAVEEALPGKLSAAQAPAVAPLTEEAELAGVIQAVNALLTALTDSGIMKGVNEP